jgi:hypothetical protein
MSQLEIHYGGDMLLRFPFQHVNSALSHGPYLSEMLGYRILPTHAVHHGNTKGMGLTG